ncbi:hypothetical protein DOTSEDRAFT_73457 [Dothistroma septosporum NZE10]|uniref:Uncharacterized protein n=1 Tax=Dothistroma septosporum (strain NZE10 / CBS 128990) TaxID=675120 RepID=N1PJ67_DOTSN|nr:hypothetical protein DOTSEDRAFT_73457 [Dothistroma septosporum NZE10]
MDMARIIISRHAAQRMGSRQWACGVATNWQAEPWEIAILRLLPREVERSEIVKDKILTRTSWLWLGAVGERQPHGNSATGSWPCLSTISNIGERRTVRATESANDDEELGIGSISVRTVPK